MKKAIVLTLVMVMAVCLNSCNNNYQTLANGVSKVINHVEPKPPYKEDSLIVLEAYVRDIYPTEDIRRKCPYGLVNFDIANANLYVKIKCNPDSIKALGNTPAGKVVEILTGTK